jgi:hypothetical protein
MPEVFHTELANILDLFYDGKTDPEEEYENVLNVLDSKTANEVLEACYQTPMNRSPFCRFAMSSTGSDNKTASKIFSCATNCFAEQNAMRNVPLPDTDMTRDQFTHGVIMLANLHALMHSDKPSSDLSGQLIEFIADVKTTFAPHK